MLPDCYEKLKEDARRVEEQRKQVCGRRGWVCQKGRGVSHGLVTSAVCDLLRQLLILSHWKSHLLTCIRDT